MSDENVVVDLETGEEVRTAPTAEERAERQALRDAVAAEAAAGAAEWSAVKQAWRDSGDGTKTQAERFAALRSVVRALFRSLDDA